MQFDCVLYTTNIHFVINSNRLNDELCFLIMLNHKVAFLHATSFFHKPSLFETFNVLCFYVFYHGVVKSALQLYFREPPPPRYVRVCQRNAFVVNITICTLFNIDSVILNSSWFHLNSSWFLYLTRKKRGKNICTYMHSKVVHSNSLFPNL